MDKTVFKNMLEYIWLSPIYEIIAYILPIVLDIRVLVILIGAFKIIPVANKII